MVSKKKIKRKKTSNKLGVSPPKDMQELRKDIPNKVIRLIPGMILELLCSMAGFILVVIPWTTSATIEMKIFLLIIGIILLTISLRDLTRTEKKLKFLKELREELEAEEIERELLEEDKIQGKKRSHLESLIER